MAFPSRLTLLLLLLLPGEIGAQVTRERSLRRYADLLGGYLAISGNAAHQGGEEEAIACIAEKPVAVHVAILTGGRIKVYSRAKSYDGVPICIMDWITQANSEHRDRFEKPANVDLVPPKP